MSAAASIYEGRPSVVVPPHQDDVPDTKVLFLAGPIRGAVNWQSMACEQLLKSPLPFLIANPRRPSFNKDEDFPPEMFFEQVDWEHRYLGRAGTGGVILFWLADEATHRCDRAYAQTTRFELGWAFAAHRAEKTKIVVGIDKNFTGGKYIRYTLEKKAPEIQIFDDLGDACTAACNLLFPMR